MKLSGLHLFLFQSKNPEISICSQVVDVIGEADHIYAHVHSSLQLTTQHISLQTRTFISC